MIAVSEKRPRRRVNFIMAPEFIPICPEHGCDMVSYKRGKVVVRFKCPCFECPHTDKAVRKLFVAVTQVSPQRPRA